MIDVLKAILRSLGIKLEDVAIRNTDYIVSNNDWIMVFEYKHHKFAIELNKVGTKESWISLVKYDEDGLVDLHNRIDVLDTSAQELHKILKDFIER